MVTGLEQYGRIEGREALERETRAIRRRRASSHSRPARPRWPADLGAFLARLVRRPAETT